MTPMTPGSPYLLSRSASQTNMSDQDDQFPPLDRLTMFDVLENLALPQHFERLQSSITAQTERVRRQQQKLRSTGANAKDKVVEEWRRRVPTPDEQLDKVAELFNAEVGREGRLTTFFADNTDADVGSLNHRDVVAAVTDAAHAFLGVGADQTRNVGFLRG